MTKPLQIFIAALLMSYAALGQGLDDRSADAFVLDTLRLFGPQRNG